MIYGIGILAFIYGFTTLNTQTGLIITILGIVLLIIFGAYELRQKSPVFNINLFRNAKFTSSNIAALCSYIAVMVVTTILNYHFQYVRGWDAQMSGMILIITPILMAIMAPNAGKLSDKVHPQKLAALGMGIAKPEHECNHEFSSSEGRSDRISFTGYHENNRSDHEPWAFDTSVCMGNGQP